MRSTFMAALQPIGFARKNVALLHAQKRPTAVRAASLFVAKIHLRARPSASLPGAFLHPRTDHHQIRASRIAHPQDIQLWAAYIPAGGISRVCPMGKRDFLTGR